MESDTDGTGRFFPVPCGDLGQLTDQRPGGSNQRYIRDPNSGLEMYVNDVISARTPSTTITLPEDDATWLNALSRNRCTTAIQRYNCDKGVIQHLTTVRVNGINLLAPTASGIGANENIPQETLGILFQGLEEYRVKEHAQRISYYEQGEEESASLVDLAYCNCLDECDDPTTSLYRLMLKDGVNVVEVSLNGRDWEEMAENITGFAVGSAKHISCVDGMLMITGMTSGPNNMLTYDTTVCGAAWEGRVIENFRYVFGKVAGDGGTWVMVGVLPGTAFFPAVDDVLAILVGSGRGKSWSEVFTATSNGFGFGGGNTTYPIAIKGNTVATYAFDDWEFAGPLYAVIASNNRGEIGSWGLYLFDPDVDLMAIAVALPDGTLTNDGLIAVADRQGRIHKARIRNGNCAGLYSLNWVITHDYCNKYGPFTFSNVHLAMNSDGRLTRFAAVTNEDVIVESDYGAYCHSERWACVDNAVITTCPADFSEYAISAVEKLTEVTIDTSIELLPGDDIAGITVEIYRGRTLVTTGVTGVTGEVTFMLPSGKYTAVATYTDHAGEKVFYVDCEDSLSVDVWLGLTIVVLDVNFTITECPDTIVIPETATVDVYINGAFSATEVLDPSGAFRVTDPVTTEGVVQFRFVFNEFISSQGARYAADLTYQYNPGGLFSLTVDIPTLDVVMCGMVYDISNTLFPFTTAADIEVKFGGVVVGSTTADPITGYLLVYAPVAGAEICVSETTGPFPVYGSVTSPPAAGVYGQDLSIASTPEVEVNVFFELLGGATVPADAADFDVTGFGECEFALWDSSPVVGNTFYISPAPGGDYLFDGTATISGEVVPYNNVVTIPDGAPSIDIVIVVEPLVVTPSFYGTIWSPGLPAQQAPVGETVDVYRNGVLIGSETIDLLGRIPTIIDPNTDIVVDYRFVIAEWTSTQGARYTLDETITYIAGGTFTPAIELEIIDAIIGGTVYDVTEPLSPTAVSAEMFVRSGALFWGPYYAIVPTPPLNGYMIVWEPAVGKRLCTANEDGAVLRDSSYTLPTTPGLYYEDIEISSNPEVVVTVYGDDGSTVRAADDFKLTVNRLVCPQELSVSPYPVLNEYTADLWGWPLADWGEDGRTPAPCGDPVGLGLQESVGVLDATRITWNPAFALGGISKVVVRVRNSEGAITPASIHLSNLETGGDTMSYLVDHADYQDITFDIANPLEWNDLWIRRDEVGATLVCIRDVTIYYYDSTVTAEGQGDTWETRPSAVDNSWYHVGEVGSGRLVAVGSYFSGDVVMVSDNDGDTWATRPCPPTLIWYSMARTNTGRLVAVGNSISATLNRVMVSDDNGDTWTIKAAAASNTWRSVIKTVSGRLVAVSSSGTGNRVMVSDDNGDTWASRPSAADNNWNSVVQTGTGRLVAVSATGTGNRVMVSDNDGDTWTTKPSAANINWQSVTHTSTGRLVAVADSGSTLRVMVSDNDGETWALRPASSDNTWSRVIEIASGRLVAVSYSGVGDMVMVSDDNGETWQPKAAAVSNNWRGLTQTSTGRLVAVSSSGTGDRVMISDGSDLPTNQLLARPMWAADYEFTGTITIAATEYIVNQVETINPGDTTLDLIVPI